MEAKLNVDKYWQCIYVMFYEAEESYKPLIAFWVETF